MIACNTTQFRSYIYINEKSCKRYDEVKNITIWTIRKVPFPFPDFPRKTGYIAPPPKMAVKLLLPR